MQVNARKNLQKLSALGVKFEVIEVEKRTGQFYDVCKKLPSRISWPMLVLPKEELLSFNYIYTCDVDTIILRESKTIEEIRKTHMLNTRQCFSNFVRPNVLPKRFSGWHFFETKPYYEKIQPLINEILLNSLSLKQISVTYKNGWGENIWENEPILYWMLKQVFTFKDKDLLQTFPHHHGLHMGVMRKPNINLRTQTKLTFNLNYWDRIDDARKILNDELYVEFQNSSHELVRKTVQNTKNYFNKPKPLPML